MENLRCPGHSISLFHTTPPVFFILNYRSRKYRMQEISIDKIPLQNRHYTGISHKNLFPVSCLQNSPPQCAPIRKTLFLIEKQPRTDSNICTEAAYKSYIFLFLHIHKLRISRQPYQFHRTNRAVSLFRNNDLCDILLLRILMIIIISVDEHYHIRILLNST